MNLTDPSIIIITEVVEVKCRETRKRISSSHFSSWIVIIEVCGWQCGIRFMKILCFKNDTCIFYNLLFLHMHMYPAKSSFSSWSHRLPLLWRNCPWRHSYCCHYLIVQSIYLNWTCRFINCCCVAQQALWDYGDVKEKLKSDKTCSKSHKIPPSVAYTNKSI